LSLSTYHGDYCFWYDGWLETLLMSNLTPSLPNLASSLSSPDVRRAIIAAIAAIGAVGVAIGFGAQLVSAIMVVHQIPTHIIGYNGMVGGIATILSAACTGRIASAFGVVRPILCMLFVGALCFLGFYVSQTLWVWFALRFVLHFAMTILFILSEFWVNHSAPPRARGFVLALYAMTLGLGFATGPMLFSFIGSRGFLPFGVGCVMIMLASLPILAAWKLAPNFKDGEHVAFLPFVFKVPTSTMAVLVYGAIQMGAMTLITPFSVTFGYDENDASRFMSVLALGNVLLLLPIGMISDRLHDKRYALAGCAIIGLIGTLIVPLIVDNFWYLSLDLFILGGVGAGLYTIGLAQLGARLRGHELAAANAAFIFCYGIGMLAGPALIGQVMVLNPAGFSNTMAAFFGFYVALVFVRLLAKILQRSS